MWLWSGWIDKIFGGEEFSEKGPSFLTMPNNFKLRPKHYFKGDEKFSCAPYLRVCLLAGQLCPSPYTFLARQSYFSHLRQKSFAQRKEMPFDCIKNVKVPGWFRLILPLLSNSDKNFCMKSR